MDEHSFEVGFIFASHIYSTFGQSVPVDELGKRLQEVASGALTLVPSPPDAIAGIEYDVGRPLPENLRASVHSMLQDRDRVNASHRESAKIMLRLMGLPFNPDREQDG